MTRRLLPLTVGLLLAAGGVAAERPPKSNGSPASSTAPAVSASAAKGSAVAEAAVPTAPSASGMPVPSPAPGGPARVSVWSTLSAKERSELIASSRERPFLERIIDHSGRFLDTPYVLSPLGEGEGVDPDPPVRYDAVDCLTFVEEVLALSSSVSDADVTPLLEDIRYGKQPTYEDRNHLMEAQWLPRNVAKGFVRDVTRQYAGADAVRVEKTLNALTWTSRSSNELKLPVGQRPTGQFPLEMIPLPKVMQHARSVPSGTLLLVVRADLPLKPTRITHLGFVMQKGKRTYLRHAARNAFGRVVDEDLESFLLRNSRYTKWRVEGVSLFAPVEQPPPPGSVATERAH